MDVLSSEEDKINLRGWALRRKQPFTCLYALRWFWRLPSSPCNPRLLPGCPCLQLQAQVRRSKSGTRFNNNIRSSSGRSQDPGAEALACEGLSGCLSANQTSGQPRPCILSTAQLFFCAHLTFLRLLHLSHACLHQCPKYCHQQQSIYGDHHHYYK